MSMLGCGNGTSVDKMIAAFEAHDRKMKKIYGDFPGPNNYSEMVDDEMIERRAKSKKKNAKQNLKGALKRLFYLSIVAYLSSILTDRY